MRKLFFYLILFFLNSCNDKRYPIKDNGSSAVQISVDSSKNFTDKLSFIKKLDFQGIWALSSDSNENASFILTHDSIDYVDMIDVPSKYAYRIEKDTLNIYLKKEPEQFKIIYASKDSFFTLSGNNDTTKYYRMPDDSK